MKLVRFFHIIHFTFHEFVIVQIAIKRSTYSATKMPSTYEVVVKDSRKLELTHYSMDEILNTSHKVEWSEIFEVPLEDNDTVGIQFGVRLHFHPP